MENECFIQVRGYELDSFNHVNNGVYLNYLEFARWEFFKNSTYKGKTWIDIINEQSLYAVVTDVQIKYIRELRNFDELKIVSKIYRNSSFIAFKQYIYKKPNIKISKAFVKMIFVDTNTRKIHEIPEFIKDNNNIKELVI